LESGFGTAIIQPPDNPAVTQVTDIDLGEKLAIFLYSGPAYPKDTVSKNIMTITKNTAGAKK